MNQRNIPLLFFLLSVLFLGTGDITWCRSDQRMTERIEGRAENRKVEIVAVDSETISVRDQGLIRTVIVNPDSNIVQQVVVKKNFLKINTPVLIQGQGAKTGAFKARVVICLNPKSFTELKRATAKGMRFAHYLGHITSTSPLKISLVDNATQLDLVVNDRTLILKEEITSLTDLQVGDWIRVLRRKIVKLPFSSQQYGTNNPRSFQLPDVAVGDINHFDPSLALKALQSPFGFFDPNMLRLHHLLVYKDFAKTMEELKVHWAAFGATFSFNWNLLQSKAGDGTYKWDRVDRIIRLSQNHNIHVIGYLKAVEPNDNHGRESHRTPSLPGNMAHYKKFVSDVVERYDGDGKDDMPGLQIPIKYWSIEDEPLAPIYFTGSGADYAKLVLGASQAIKIADPSAKVIVSMIRGTGWLKKAGDPRAFMESFFRQLAALTKETPYDILDQHWLGKAEDIAPSMQYVLYQNWLEDIENTAAKYGFHKVPFVNLEMAGSSSSPKDHAADLLKRHVFLLSLGVEKILWSGLKEAPAQKISPQQADNYFRKVSLIDEGGQRKLAYWTYKLMIDILDGSDWHKTRTLKNNADGLFIFEFRKENQPVWVVWNDVEKSTTTITIPKNIKRIALIHAVPCDKINQVSAKGNNGTVQQHYLNVKDGQVSIEVGALPVFIVSAQNIK